MHGEKAAPAAFPSHAKGDHLPGTDASERGKTDGREGRAYGSPLQRQGRGTREGREFRFLSYPRCPYCQRPTDQTRVPDPTVVGATRREARPGRIFDRFRDTLSWVKLFGSRARGDYKTTSDVDLAIASKTDVLTPLQTALEDSQLPYTFDLEDGIERSQTGSSRLARVRMLCQK